MALRTGMAIVTLLLIHMCRVLNTYRHAMDTVIEAAVVGGTITTEQSNTVNTFLNGAQAACNVMKAITGYS
jgi:hypothetical protein